MATKSVTSNDFAYYGSNAAGKQYSANIYIPASEIKLGMFSNRTVYFMVYKGNVVHFGEVICAAL